MKAISPCLIFAFVSCMKAPDPHHGIQKNTTHESPSNQITETEAPAVNLITPKNWKETPPTLSFFLKMWELPEGGIANISWLGTNTKIIQMNLDRWIGQWEVESGSPKDEAQIWALEDCQWETTIATLQGTLTATNAIGGGDPRKDWMLIAAIIKAPQGPIYFKMMAPKSLAQKQQAEVLEMIRNIQINE